MLRTNKNKTKKKKKESNILALKCDISNESQIKQCIDKINSHFKCKVSVLVNNAGPKTKLHIFLGVFACVFTIAILRNVALSL